MTVLNKRRAKTLPLEGGGALGAAVATGKVSDIGGQSSGPPRAVEIDFNAQQFSFCPERGCVVSTSRSTSTPYQAILLLHALRLVLRTQPRSAK
jgi:hypothetical protein